MVGYGLYKYCKYRKARKCLVVYFKLVAYMVVRPKLKVASPFVNHSLIH